MKPLLYAFLPPFLLTLLLCGIYILPQDTVLKNSAISSKMPLSYALDGWYGEKLQETEIERATLPSDTIFSKASYVNTGINAPPISVSIVYSGSDMNASIHRPERCLPSQGHTNIISSDKDIKLDNEVDIHCTRLVSRTSLRSHNGLIIQHINYYLFIGHDSMRSNHLNRTLQDIFDRIVKGRAQRWAYFQVGSYWSDEIGISEQTCDDNLKSLIEQLLPKIINWEKIAPEAVKK